MSNNTPIQEIKETFFNKKEVRLFIKRDDLLFDEKAPDFNGNKRRKMKYNLLAAKEKGFDTLLTFGGAFSNHIAATAAAGNLLNFKTIGIIRGERPKELNPTLKKVLDYGMQLKFITRAAYQEKTTPSFIENLTKEFGAFYLIPEGGSNGLALKGCAEIISEIRADFPKIIPTQSLPNYICSACGTGGTFSGIVAGIGRKTKAIGYAVLKGNFHTAEINTFLQANYDTTFSHWEICNDYHFGGFAKHKPPLVNFINTFKKKTQHPARTVIYRQDDFWNL